MANNQNQQNGNKQKQGKGDGGKDISKDPILSNLVNQYLEDLVEMFVENYDQKSTILKNLGEWQAFIDKYIGNDLGQLLTSSTASLLTSGVQTGLITAGMQPEAAETAKESLDALLDAVRRQYRLKGNKLTTNDVGKITEEQLKKASATKEQLMTYVRARRLLSTEQRELLDIKRRAYCRIKESNKKRWHAYKFRIKDVDELRLLIRLDVEEEWDDQLEELYGPVKVNEEASKKSSEAPAIAKGRQIVDNALKLLDGTDPTMQAVALKARRVAADTQTGMERSKRTGRTLDALLKR